MVQVNHDTPLWMQLYAEEQYEKAWKILHESFETQEDKTPCKIDPNTYWSESAIKCFK
jgi:hypothetical protein